MRVIHECVAADHVHEPSMLYSVGCCAVAWRQVRVHMLDGRITNVQNVQLGAARAGTMTAIMYGL